MLRHRAASLCKLQEFCFHVRKLIQPPNEKSRFDLAAATKRSYPTKLQFDDIAILYYSVHEKMIGKV